jgi:hypothetical protein
MQDQLEKLNSDLRINNTDEFGLIVQSDKDGGDTPQRVACWALVNKFANTNYGDKYLEAYLQHCNPWPGRYFRHPKGPHNNINNFTRDQSEILQIAFYMFGRKDLLDQLIKQRAKRLLFHFNTQDEQVKLKLPDPPSLFELSCWLRFYLGWWAAPLCNLLDVELVTGVVIARYNKRASWDSDAKLIPQIIFANAVCPTLMAKLARWLYRKRPTLVKTRLYNYFGVPPSLHNGVPALGKALYLCYRKLICQQ